MKEERPWIAGAGSAEAVPVVYSYLTWRRKGRPVTAPGPGAPGAIG
jgi:hypothetical protein